jgi:hypothetical protein
MGFELVVHVTKKSWLMVTIMVSMRWQGIETMARGGLRFVRWWRCCHLSSSGLGDLGQIFGVVS